MQKKIIVIDRLVIITIVLLIIISVTGLCAFNLSNSYEVINQYGDTVKMWGSGVYSHDSYFRAPIFIGTDCTMLLITIPLIIFALIQERKKRNNKTRLFLVSIMSVVLYYSASIALGVTYNILFLAYLALFACSFFAFILLLLSIDYKDVYQKQTWSLPTKGISIFLIVSGISLFVAWLPDIMPTLWSGKSLSLIEVYTTEITYVLDMGLISPVIFICLYQLKGKNPFGHSLLAILLLLCSIVGIMVTVQSLFQIAAGIDVPLPALITKAGIFVILASVAIYYNYRFYKKLII